jgi:hypothetical protein
MLVADRQFPDSGRRFSQQHCPAIAVIIMPGAHRFEPVDGSLHRMCMLWRSMAGRRVLL